MLCGATQDRWVIVERSDKMWSTGEGNGKPLQYSCLENPMNSIKRQKDRTLKDELPRSVGAQYGFLPSGPPGKLHTLFLIPSHMALFAAELGKTKYLLLYLHLQLAEAM